MKEKIKGLIEEIYKNIVKFVDENKGNDDKYYNRAYLTLPDNNELTFRFGDKSVDFYTSEDAYYNDNLWGSFSVDNSGRIDVTLEKSGRHIVVEPNFELKVYDYTEVEVTEKDVTRLFEWLTELKESTENLSYNIEKTRSFENLLRELVVKYNTLKMTDYANKNNGNVLPSIMAAANWWCKEIVRPYERRKSYEEEYDGYVLSPEELEEELRISPKFEYIEKDISKAELLIIKETLIEQMIRLFKNGEREVVAHKMSDNIDMYAILQRIGNNIYRLFPAKTIVSMDYAVAYDLNLKLIPLYGTRTAPTDYKELLGIQEEPVEEVSKQKK